MPHEVLFFQTTRRWQVLPIKMVSRIIQEQTSRIMPRMPGTIEKLAFQLILGKLLRRLFLPVMGHRQGTTPFIIKMSI